MSTNKNLQVTTIFAPLKNLKASLISQETILSLPFHFRHIDVEA